MTKRRSSISGRGSEILLGIPRPVEIEPRGPDLAPTEAGHPELESTTGSRAFTRGKPPLSWSESEPRIDEAELEQALLEEAKAGAPVPKGEGEALNVLDVEPPPTPEMELALFEEALRAGEPSEPMARMPIPTVESRRVGNTRGGEMAFQKAPSPETDSILPARVPRAGLDMGKTVSRAYDGQASDEEVVPPELTEGELSKEEQAALPQGLDSARIQELDEEISRTYDLVLSQVGENGDIAKECFNQLRMARDIVLRRDEANIAQAEYYVEQVRARLKRASDSEAWTRKYAWWITAWGFVWGFIFLSLLILLNQSWFRDLIAPPDAGNPIVNTEIFLPAMLWGGVGGVVAVWYNLFKHVSQRDFDSQYNLSYVGKPFLGLILGATVYMFFHLMLTLRILPAGLEEGEGTGFSTVSPWIIYPVAWACGFKENRIFGLMDRIMKRVFSGEENSLSAAGESIEPVG